MLKMAFLTLTVSFALNVGAQEPAEPTKDKVTAGAESTEKIEVTGSRIKRIDTEGPKPVVVITSEDIKSSGAASLNELLSNRTEVTFGSFSSSSGQGDSDFQSVNIRGIGSGYTLVLINGRRLHRDPYFEMNDLTNIPLTAIDRVEMLKGAASAVYGSDALGGVVNIITRKDFSGIELYYRHDRTLQEGGNQDFYSITQGVSSGKLQSTTIVTKSDRENLMYFDIPGFKKGLKYTSNPVGSYLGQGANGPAFFTTGECPNGVQVTGQGELCQSDYADAEEAGESSRLNLLNDFSYDFTDSTRFFSTTMVTRKQTRDDFSENFVTPSHSSYGVLVPAEQVQAAIDDGRISADTVIRDQNGNISPMRIQTSLPEAGRKVARSDSLAYTGIAGINQTLGQDFELTLSVSDSRIKRVNTMSNSIVTPLFVDKLESGEFDPLKSSDRGDLSDVVTNTSTQVGSYVRSYEAVLNGSVDTPMLPIDLSFGTSSTKEGYAFAFDPLTLSGNILNSGGSGGKGSRTSGAVFGEVLLPLEVPFLRSVEFKIAGRHDKYSDYGNSTTPDLGISIRPNASFLIKTSFGRGFKAPGLRDVNDDPGLYFTRVSDVKRCREARAAADEALITKYCNSTQSTQILTGGNKELDAETSEFYNIGVGFEPNSSFSASLEYYDIKIKDQIAAPDSTTMMEYEADGKALPAGVVIQRDETSGDVSTVVLPSANLAATTTRGVDAAASISQMIGQGRIGLSTNYTRVISFRQETVEGLGFEEQIGQRGFPKWRATNSLSYRWHEHRIAIANNNIGEHDKAAGEGKIARFTWYDAQYRWNHSWDGEFTLGYKNIFKQTPSRDELSTAWNHDTAFYSLYGPAIYAALSQRI